jgi:hypothetical protein
MTKAEAIALLELNATPEQYITQQEYTSAFKKCTEDTQVTNDDLSYGGNIISIVVDKFKYSVIAVHKQDWTGDWDTDSVVYVKQPYMTYEEMVSLMTAMTSNDTEPCDFPMERKRPENVEFSDFD